MIKRTIRNVLLKCLPYVCRLYRHFGIEIQPAPDNTQLPSDYFIPREIVEYAQKVEMDAAPIPIQIAESITLGGVPGAHSARFRGMRSNVPGAHVIAFLMLALAGSAYGQSGGSQSTGPRTGNAAPTGGCGNQQMYVNNQTGDLYDCKAGIWFPISSLPTLPTTPNGVSFILTSTPSGGVGGAATFSWIGEPGRSNAGATDTIVATDRGGGILETNGGAVAVTLPQAGTTNFANNFDFFIKGATTTVITITPTVSTIAGNDGTLGATLVLPAASTAYCYSLDNVNYQCSVVGSSGITGLTIGFLPKASSGTAIANSLCDEAITTANALTCTDTAGIRAPSFTATGSTAGFSDYPQGTTSAAVAPCNTATSICEQAPAAVTSYLVTKPGVAAQGIITNNVTAAVDTQGFSGDSGHSAVVTIGSGSDIAATSLCSTTLCPVGTYEVTVYIDMTTPCGTTGTFIAWLGYTDDSGARAGSSTTTFFDIAGTGSVPATGTLTTTSTANFGQATYILRTTGAATGGLGSINYGATRTACGSAGPMVGKMYLNVVPLG